MDRVWKRIPVSFLVVMVGLLTLNLLGDPAGQIVSAGADVGPIAYVRADTGDEIRLVEPDGSNDRLLWTTGRADPVGTDEVWSLDWRPDGAELAFASTHESWCSIQSADIYAVGRDGAGYRRITQAPACPELAGFPTGVVEVPVRDVLYTGFDGFVYFQGAASAQPVTLEPGGGTVVTFSEVADLGDGVLQLASTIVSGDRGAYTETAVDVQAGAVTRTGQLSLSNTVFPWDVASPTWRSDSSRIGYVWNLQSLLALPWQPDLLALGDDLLAVERDEQPYFSHLDWGPPTRANELLYAAETWDFDEGTTENIYLVTEGSATAGQRLLSFESGENVLGLAWLPDGSGFIYSVVELDDETYEFSSANVFLYLFATQTATPLTGFTNEFAGQVSVSPDGRQIVFERGATLTTYQDRVERPDLWMINHDGTQARLLVANGRAPAWAAPAREPAPTGYRLSLPFTVRDTRE